MENENKPTETPAVPPVTPPAPTPPAAPVIPPAPATPPVTPTEPEKKEPDYKALYEQAQRDQALQAENSKKDTAITTALAEPTVLAIEPAAVAALIDRSKLTVDKDGNVTGVAEEITRLKTAYPKLFNEIGSADGAPGGGTPPSANTGNTFFQSLLAG